MQVSVVNKLKLDFDQHHYKNLLLKFCLFRYKSADYFRDPLCGINLGRDTLYRAKFFRDSFSQTSFTTLLLKDKKEPSVPKFTFSKINLNYIIL